MRLRQEQVVLLVSVVILGFMSWSVMQAKTGRRSSKRTSALELDHFTPPDVARALPNPEITPALRRELFAPPRDTRPLPPLDLVEPPRRPLAGLLPPSDPGPAPVAFGKVLRREVPVLDVPDLFADAEIDGGFGDTSFDEAASGGGADGQSIRDLLARSTEDGNSFEDETPAERAARHGGYRQRYDWIQRAVGQSEYGRIENEDRFGLKTDPDRANEAILFVRIDPETGREWFKNVGAPPIPVARNEMIDFAFADTVANQLELRRREIGDKLTRGSFEEALELAAFAVENRLEAPQALEVAEGLYRLCAAYDAEDPEPRLGLARCYEAGFQFEKAFEEYNALLEPFAHRAAVHVRLAQLEDRFLMGEQAEERLRHALAVDSGSWEARWGLGTFLADRGEFEEAIELLQQANRAAPNDPELMNVRVAIRNDLADALFGAGDLEEANSVYGQALSADSGNQHAQAGRLTTALLLEQSGGLSDDLGDGDGFELLVARAQLALSNQDWVTARELLELAADAQPLRADTALGALSYLAQITGHPAEAMAYAEEALERDPNDPYALFQKGRLLGDQDDYEGARAALLAALEVELDFEDALVALGQMAFQLGRFTDAQRYLERAVQINGERPEVFALLGVDFLRLGSVPDARASFERARLLDPTNPTAKAGLAWCTYLDGDVTEALVLLADIDESRRNEPEEDPWRVWAKDQMVRIQDHTEKVEWRDNFNRKRLINGWLTREGVGPIVSMDDGAAKIEGVFDGPGTTQIYREYPASQFVSFEADVWIEPDSNVRAGVFVARERQRKTERDVIAEASVSRHKDGDCQVRFISQGQPEDLTDMQQPLPTGQWVHLSILRSGESSQTTMTLSMDGIPLIENRSLPSAGTASSPLLVGLFVEGEPGRTAKVKMDNVSVVYRP